MAKKIILTGVTPSGVPHLGNYIGAIKPNITLSHDPENKSYIFIADYHSLVKCWDPKLRGEYSLKNAATWLALGLDPKTTHFYRQSDIPEILELTWILNTVSAKGLLNRSHAYKALVAENLETGQKDADKGITMGLFSYPVLMSADILIFNPNLVPVGKDQIQHVEIARDIAMRFNHLYGETFVLPEAKVDRISATIPGLDGRKMSKSYQNTIPIFEPSKQLRKLIMKIKTNSLEPHEPKDTDDSTLFQLYLAFAEDNDIGDIKQRYQSGIGWGEMKQILFEKIDQRLAGPREKYQYYLDNPKIVEDILQTGANRVRPEAIAMLEKVKQAVGISTYSV